MEPSRFTLEGLGMSHSSTMDSIFAMSTDDVVHDTLRNNTGAQSNVKLGLGPPHGGAPSLEGTIQSDNSLVSWQGGKSHKNNISARVRSMGSQLSMEFSEADS